MRAASRGFTLTELAVVMAIVALLLGGAVMTLSAQQEQRDRDETLRRVNGAVDAILGYAMVNRRLPCPAVTNATGDEAPAGGGTCTSAYGGYLPARTIGFQPTDSAGYAIDVWGNRLRYAVASGVTGCTGSSTTPHFTHQTNLRANGVSCKPNGFDICTTSVGISGTACSGTATRVVSSDTIVFLVFSTGKNGALPSTSQGVDEQANTNGDGVFVTRLPGTADTAGGAFDDIMVIVPAAVFYSKMIAAGVLP